MDYGKDLFKDLENYVLNGVKRYFFDSLLLNEEDVLMKRYRVVFVINDFIDNKVCGFFSFVLNDVFL